MSVWKCRVLGAAGCTEVLRECGRHWAGSAWKPVPGEGPLCLWLGNLKIRADEEDLLKVVERGLSWEPVP